MRIFAAQLRDGGAVLIDESTGYPLPIPPATFISSLDAEAFIAWAGEIDGINHLRSLVRRWPRLRELPECPLCPHRGRVEPGETMCGDCREAANVE